ncbi:MAG: hypothetical protein Ct9H300mP14_03010 [Gammaproteobacteria bacterium]|nr:MAG: hypothetical protein Ct9H300mP14_03010 [Gammaproteobacteria bacterium]
MFEQFDQAGGLMRTNIPAFRLPAQVLDDEISMIVERVWIYGWVTGSTAWLLFWKEDFPAVFVGTGARAGKNSPARSAGNRTNPHRY